MPLSELQLTRIAVNNQARMSAYARRVGDTYAKTFRVIGGADGEAERAWKAFAAPTMQSTQRHVLRTQESYVRLMARGMDLTPNGHVDPERIVNTLDELVDRYGSPIIDVRAGLADGKGWDQSLAEAMRHADELARTDVAEATRDSATASMSGIEGIVAYRRVPSGTACDFCLLIAGQTYRTEELSPAHNNCTCGVAPLSDESDPTFARQQALSKELYADQQRVDDAQAQADAQSPKESA